MVVNCFGGIERDGWQVCEGILFKSPWLEPRTADHSSYIKSWFCCCWLLRFGILMHRFKVMVSILSNVLIDATGLWVLCYWLFALIHYHYWCSDLHAWYGCNLFLSSMYWVYGAWIILCFNLSCGLDCVINNMEHACFYSLIEGWYKICNTVCMVLQQFGDFL